jgi:hypothetical protein
MGTMRLLLAIAAVMAAPAAAATAQILEIGAGLGRGCVGDSSGFCGDEAGLMWAATAGIRLDDRIELSVRLARLPLPDLTYVVRRDDRFNVASDPAVRQLPQIVVADESRSRQILSGEAVYHFRRGSTVRPMLGLGLGTRIHRDQLSCRPVGCEELMPVLASGVGRTTSRAGNITIVAGLSGRVHDRVQLRGGVRLHNFAGEEISTTEVFIATAYRVF